MTVFADTFALIAWLNGSDSAHDLIATYFDEFTGKLLATEWVLVELADAMSAPTLRSIVADFLRVMRDDPLFEIVEYDAAVYQAGFDLFIARPDKAWSLTDCISFAVMTKRGITEALTADHHFEQAGFHAIFA